MIVLTFTGSIITGLYVYVYMYILQVDVVDPESITEEFVNILSTSVIAVHVNAKVITHSTL